MKAIGTLVLSLLLIPVAHTAKAQQDDIFIIRDTDSAPEAVVSSIKTYAEENEDWIYLADFPLKGGELTAVKICYLPIGEDIFAAGLHVGAMMPCGHIAVYEEDGTTRVSALKPRFMTELHDDPNLEKAVSKAEPAFKGMLEDLGLD